MRDRLNDAECAKLRTEVRRLTWANLALVTKLEKSAILCVRLSEQIATLKTVPKPAPTRATFGGGS